MDLTVFGGLDNNYKYRIQYSANQQSVKDGQFTIVDERGVKTKVTEQWLYNVIHAAIINKRMIDE